jgi:hypothetical protein
MTSVDSGLRFWLSYVEHCGGLVEPGSGSALVVLPEPLQAQLGLAETLTVTGDPEVAREDGVVLLATGHSVLTLSAEAVLAGADVGRAVLPWPGDQLPGATDLLERARGSFPVGHGRIDLAGAPTRAYLPVLRAGAMINYVVAGDEAFQERSECWLDADLRRELPDNVRAALDTALAAIPTSLQRAEQDSTSVVPIDLDRAVNAAHDLLRSRAGRRLDTLDEDGRHAQAAEITRTEAYYHDVLAGIERRRTDAAPDRQAALDSRAEATRQERSRRLAEIKEKHQARFDLTPYRLHLLLVPAVVLPVNVMRGSRRYPQRLVWIWPARRFRALPCPTCGSDRPLVAGKTVLGCEACLARPVPEPTPPPTKPTVGAGPTKPTVGAGPAKPATSKPATSKPTTAKPTTKPARTISPTARPSAVREPSPGQVRAIGDRLVTSFWQSVANDDGQLAKRLLPDSPASTALRLFGVRGLAFCIGIPPGDVLTSVSGRTRAPGPGRRFVCEGGLQTREESAPFPFALVWQLRGNHAVVDEILPHAAYDPNTLPYGVHLTPGRLRLQRLPGQPILLDPVAASLTDEVLPAEGLPLLARCLTAWWRIDRPHPTDIGPDPDVTAAAVLRLVSWRCAPRVSTAECARRFGVRADSIKAAEAGLKPRLRLSPDVVW